MNDRPITMQLSKGEAKAVMRWRSLRGQPSIMMILAISARGEPIGMMGVLPLENLTSGSTALAEEFTGQEENCT